MRFLASRRWRIFLIAWLLYSAHFATNVVREHYPAFSLAERGTFKVDEYQGFHSDIFRHRDGHSYVGNNVIVSVMVAVPLWLFDPVLDALEEHSKRKLEASQAPPTVDYRTKYPNRRAFFALVKQRGLDLRFGAATLITSAFFMAPFSALCLVLMYQVLRWRRVEPDRATFLTFLFGFGTPVFFRTAHLNHNLFLMYAAFLGFVLLWVRPEEEFPLSWRRRFAAGFLGGFTLAADYMGVLLLLGLYLYLFVCRLPSASWWRSFRESLAYVAGSVPPVLFLLYSQWAMYGHPIYPGQVWMPKVNYTEFGWRGLDWPAADLFLLNLFDPGYGMYAFGPLLLLGLIPVFRYDPESLILPLRERRFVAGLFVALMVFCAANQYSRMQFNSGFRYLIPLIPFVYLQLCDHLVRIPRSWLYVLSAPVLLHSWVIAVMREPVVESWRLFLTEGVQLRALNVLRMTSSPDSIWSRTWLLSSIVLVAVFLSCWGIWAYGARLESRAATPGMPREG